jgi:hypothetical protein
VHVREIFKSLLVSQKSEQFPPSSSRTRFNGELDKSTQNSGIPPIKVRLRIIWSNLAVSRIDCGNDGFVAVQGTEPTPPRGVCWVGIIPLRATDPNATIRLSETRKVGQQISADVDGYDGRT